ncbi:unnamed protein product [Rotaria socialis]
MSNTSKEIDLSSVITQVSKDDDPSRTIPLTGTVITSPAAPVTKTRSSRKYRLVSFLLCCLSVSNRSRSRSAIYSQKKEGSNNQELIALNTDLNIHFEAHEKFLLSTLRSNERVKICLVIDLDETLVHSSFKPVPNADFVVPVEIDGQVHQVYVTKRPHVDEFLRCVGERYECVLFTASLAKYADPVADLLDPNHIFHSRLFRESCTYYNVSDHRVPVTSWFDDMHDTELQTLIPIFDRLASVDDVIPALQDIHHRRDAV